MRACRSCGRPRTIWYLWATRWASPRTASTSRSASRTTPTTHSAGCIEPAMNRSRLLFIVCSALLVLPMLMALVLSADPARGRHADIRKDKEEDSFDTYLKYLKVFSEVLGLIRDTYVDEPNTEALMAGALEGVTDAMDPFSVYVPAAAVPGYVKALAAGKSLSGLALLKERGATLVMSVEKGSPADAAGLKVNDLVAKLNGNSTRTMPLWQMQEELVGSPGAKIALEARLHGLSQASFELKPFTLPAVSVSEVGENGSPAAGARKAAPRGSGDTGNQGERTATVLRIPSFTAETAAQVRGALGPRGQVGNGKLLVDLRGVSSGDPEAAYDVAKLFASGELGALPRRKHARRA